MSATWVYLSLATRTLDSRVPKRPLTAQAAAAALAALEPMPLPRGRPCAKERVSHGASASHLNGDGEGEPCHSDGRGELSASFTSLPLNNVLYHGPGVLKFSVLHGAASLQTSTLMNPSMRLLRVERGGIRRTAVQTSGLDPGEVCNPTDSSRD